MTLPGLVTTQVTYDYLLRPAVVTETAAPSNGTGTPVTRTTTTTYENSGKSPRVSSVAITGGLGTALPAQTSGHDGPTGLPLTSAYDDFGRTISFTDADNANHSQLRESLVPPREYIERLFERAANAESTPSSQPSQFAVGELPQVGAG